MHIYMQYMFPILFWDYATHVMSQCPFMFHPVKYGLNRSSVLNAGPTFSYLPADSADASLFVKDSADSSVCADLLGLTDCDCTTIACRL